MVVLPAPKTPFRGRSVFPSTNAKRREPRVARTYSSGLHSRGYMACHKAVSAELLVWQLLLLTKDLVLRLPSTWLNGLRLCYARFWTTPPRCSMILKTKCSSCPSSVSSLSIESLVSHNCPSLGNNNNNKQKAEGSEICWFN